MWVGAASSAEPERDREQDANLIDPKTQRPKDPKTQEPKNRKTRMARGWESKAIESQQESAADRRHRAPPISAADAARQAERNTLMLARTRVMADLQLACMPAHRAMLEQAMADLDRRLALL
jgi:hypothetical protein